MKPASTEIERLLSEYFTALQRNRCERGVDLARYVADDVTREESESFRGHLDGCAICRAALEQFEAQSETWNVAGETGSGSLLSRFLSWWTIPGVALAASAAVLVLVLMLVPFSPAELPENGLVPKGSWQLYVAAERDGQTFRVNDGSFLKEGDRLGFFYSSDRSGHTMILYADESGEIARLFPAMESRSTPAVAGQKIRVPDGAVVSSGSGCEWVVGIFSARPFDDSTARRAVRRMLDSRSGCRLDPDSSGLEKVDIQVLQVNR